MTSARIWFAPVDLCIQARMWDAAVRLRRQALALFGRGIPLAVLASIGPSFSGSALATPSPLFMLVVALAMGALLAGVK